MWPEHLVRRPFLSGDAIEMRDLEADKSLNGQAGTVEGPGAAHKSFLSPLFSHYFCLFWPCSAIFVVRSQALGPGATW